jgi:(p)ppGpp synthase/HD superfamily hydrolase
MSNDLPARARTLAQELHTGQLRKGTGMGYLDGHLDPVAELVRAAGGTDVQIAAAYLHDTAEDCGGRPVLDRISAEIGPDVATIVEHVSDSFIDARDGTPKEDWLVRKRRYVHGLADAPDDVLEVSVADKLHNARSFLADYLAAGPETWAKFNEQQPELQLWYYVSLADLFQARIPQHPLTTQLDQCMDDVVTSVRVDVPDIDARIERAKLELAGSPDAA